MPDRPSGGERRPPESRARIPLRVALALTLVAGGVGWCTDRIAVHAGWTFPSFGYLIGEVVWKLASLGVLLWALRRYERAPLQLATIGLGPDEAPTETFPTGPFFLVLAVALVLAATVGTPATRASAYSPARHAGLGLAVTELVIRYPLTVFSEEALFRGWLQPRLGRYGPILSALLWAIYHLQQASTIPSLVVFGLLLGGLRWLNGNVRLTSVIHYVSNAVFFITTYL